MERGRDVCRMAQQSSVTSSDLMLVAIGEHRTLICVMEHRLPICREVGELCSTISWPVLQETEENFARFWAMEGATPVFPRHYQTSALIGCVDIVDCLKVRGFLGHRGFSYSLLICTTSCLLMSQICIWMTSCGSVVGSAPSVQLESLVQKIVGKMR